MPIWPKLSGLPRAYWLLWTGSLINRLGDFVVPFLAIYLTEQRGLSVAQAGTVVGLYGGGSLASGPVGGLCADRFGRKRTLALVMLLGAAAMLHLGYADGLYHLMLATLLLGFCGSLYRPIVSAAIADLIPAADRPRAYGFLYWAINFGFACSTLVAGAAVQFGFRKLFWGDALTSAAFGLLVFLWVPETQSASKGTREAAHKDLLRTVTDGVFLAFLGCTLLTSLVFGQASATLPLSLREAGVSMQGYGALMAINGGLIVLLQPFAIPIVQRFQRSGVMAFAALLIGGGFGLNAVAHRPLLYALSIALWTLGEIAMMPVAFSIVADLSPPEVRGSYQGIYHLTWSISSCLAPILGAALLARGGSSVLWGSCCAVGCLAALGHLAIAGPRERRLTARSQDGSGLALATD